MAVAASDRTRPHCISSCRTALPAVTALGDDRRHVCGRAPTMAAGPRLGASRPHPPAAISTYLAAVTPRRPVPETTAALLRAPPAFAVSGFQLLCQPGSVALSSASKHSQTTTLTSHLRVEIETCLYRWLVRLRRPSASDSAASFSRQPPIAAHVLSPVSQGSWRWTLDRDVVTRS